jgi:hypothetical protein
MKLVEKALYDSKIPGVVPHRQDERTIKIPIPKLVFPLCREPGRLNRRRRPTIDARKELFTSAKQKAEEIRVQIRKHHQASLKRGKFAKHSVELEEVRSSPLHNQHELTIFTVPEAHGSAYCRGGCCADVASEGIWFFKIKSYCIFDLSTSE